MCTGINYTILGCLASYGCSLLTMGCLRMIYSCMYMNHMCIAIDAAVNGIAMRLNMVLS